MRAIIKAALILLAVLLITLAAAAKENIPVHFNFYQGIRAKEKTTPTVAASYYLKPLSKDHLIFHSPAHRSKEKEKLKRIYNLSEVKPLIHEKWQWDVKQELKAKRHHVIVLSGHVYVVRLTLIKPGGGFRLEIVEKQDKQYKHFLDTEFTLPGENTAIFGFEDSKGKIYFLSFHRPNGKKARNVEEKEPVELSSAEELVQLKRVDPVYPQKAVEKRIEGAVIMEVVIDSKGRITNVNITKGEHPLLNEAAVQAVKQWIYQPYLVKGVAKAVKFTVVLDFYFN